MAGFWKPVTIIQRLIVWELNLRKNISLPPPPNLQYPHPHNSLKIINGYFPNDLPKNQKYDFIIFNDVFEHIPNVEMIVKNCYDSLNSNGIVIINLPLNTGFIYWLSYLMYRIFGTEKYLNRLYQFDYVSPHLYYFNKRNLTTLLRKNNFTLLKYHRVSTLVKGSVASRINMLNTKMNRLSVFLIESLLPLTNILPEDCGCFYYKKTD